jgi:hypothetical protein
MSNVEREKAKSEKAVESYLKYQQEKKEVNDGVDIQDWEDSLAMFP